MTAARYAVFWAPEPEHPLWQAGCEWLARDPASPALQWPARDATAEPRRYGFHATLKAPMKLREERDATSLVDAVGALAARTRRFMLPALYIAWMQQFLALQPRHHVLPTHPLRQLADACAREFDPWRAPPPDDEPKRRLADPHWRFHMTLTDSLHYTDPRRDTLLQDAQRHFAAALAEPLGCASLCIFAEPAPGAPFVLTHRFKLAP